MKMRTFENLMNIGWVLFAIGALGVFVCPIMVIPLVIGAGLMVAALVG